MIIPVIRVAIVKSQSGDTLSLETEWNVKFRAHIENAEAFALEHFTTSFITILDMNKPNPQVEILQYAPCKVD